MVNKKFTSKLIRIWLDLNLNQCDFLLKSVEYGSMYLSGMNGLIARSNNFTNLYSGATITETTVRAGLFFCVEICI